MRLSPLAVLRQAGLTAAEMGARPGGRLAETLEHYRDEGQKLDAEEQTLRAALTRVCVRLPPRKCLAGWIAGVTSEDGQCPPAISRQLKTRLKAFVEAAARLAELAEKIDREVVGVMEALPDWLEGLRGTPFAAGLHASSEQLYRDVFERRLARPLRKKDRQALLSAMRLAQRAAYRTTPFPGLAQAAVFEFDKSKPNRSTRCKPKHRVAADQLWVALSSSYDPEDPDPLIYRETDRGVEAVRPEAPELVSKAVRTLGLALRPKAIDLQQPEAIAVLEDLIEIGVAVLPQRLDPLPTERRAPIARTSDFDAARRAVSLAVARLEPLYAPLSRLGAFARVDALRAWARATIGPDRIRLSRLCRAVELAPPSLTSRDLCPELVSRLLEASAWEGLTREVAVPISVARTEPRLSSLSMMIMYDAERDLVVLNRVLPGGMRQIVRFLDPHEHSDAAADWLSQSHGAVRLILRPHAAAPYQRIPSFGAPSLYLPREPFDAEERMVGLDEVEVACNDENFRFSLTRDGREVAPFYAGCVREANLHIGAQLICALSATPYAEPLDRLLEVHSLNDQQLLSVGHPLPKRRPRIIAGGTVLQRRRWAYRAADVPLPMGLSVSGREFLTLDGWRREHGMPMRCSARKLTPGVLAYGQAPGVLLDFSRPESVADVRRALKLGPADWLVLEECLPDPMPPGATGRATEITVELRF